MTKLNNKGVSLIDCLIAVAVLALLVSPIIAQLFTTIQVSAEAKEKQYVIDDATEVYEYFRKYDNKELSARANEAGFELDATTPIESGTRVCELRLKDGTVVTPMKNGVAQTVKYNWTKYNLVNATDIGREKSSYARSVVRTNLRNKLYELGYQIDYSTTNGSTMSGLPTTYTFRSDNSIVQYDTTGNGVYDDSAITGIVVKKKDGIEDSYINELLDPNDIDIGNVQDIDAEKMAIISGDATAVDYQLDQKLQNVLVQYATANPSSAIGTYSNDTKQLNNYIKAIINNSSSTSKVRRIKVYVTAGELDSSSEPKYYVVKCDVTYRVTFSGSDLKAFDNFTSTTGEFTFPLMSERKFYTNTPPDIYMIYEPLLLSTSMNSYVYYADNDYISIYTDKYTSGVDDGGTDSSVDTSDDKTRDGKDPSRLYLIRSVKNWAKVANTERGTHVATESNVSNFDPTAYYSYRYGRFVPVNIFINMERTIDTDLQPLDIYTNISMASLHNPDAANIGEFEVDEAGSKAGLRDANNYAYPNPPSVSSGWTRYAYDPNRIIRVDNEKGIETIDRLGQITVTYQKIDSATNSPVGEVTYITGAKGAD